MAAWVILAAIFAVSYAAAPSIVRPCRLNDYNCIGANLQANSKCRRPVVGSIPGRYTVPVFPFDTPYFNASYVDKNMIVRNQNKCYVSEFFINKISKRLVLGIDCPNLDVESDRTLVQHLGLREPDVFNFHIRGTYPLVRITIVLSSNNGLNLCAADSEIFTEVKALPILDIKPQDRRTEENLNNDLSLLNIYEIENFFYRGKPLAKIFVDSLLCNYGCAF